MELKELEDVILKKLKDGLLDGVVGDDFDIGSYATVTFRKVIMNGIPKILRIGADSKYFDNKETVKVGGKVTEKVFESKDEILTFFKKFGWLMKDPDVKKYSSFFKPKK